MAKTNRERLICIENKVDQVITGFNNHLEHHKRLYDKLFKIFLVALSPVVAMIIWAVITVVKAVRG